MFNQFIQPEIDEANKKHLQIQAEKELIRHSEIYNSLVTMGISYFEKGEFESARIEFQQALDFKPYDKRANLGLTKCLLAQCKTQNTQCKMSMKYYNFMISSNTLTKVEINELNTLKQ